MYIYQCLISIPLALHGCDVTQKPCSVINTDTGLLHKAIINVPSQRERNLTHEFASPITKQWSFLRSKSLSNIEQNFLCIFCNVLSRVILSLVLWFYATHLQPFIHRRAFCCLHNTIPLLLNYSTCGRISSGRVTIPHVAVITFPSHFDLNFKLRTLQHSHLLETF
jgi:hypothetical protein